MRKAPDQVKVNTIAVPQEVLELHKNIVLGIDFFFVNGMVFFITVSSKIKFITVEYVTDRKILTTAMDCLNAMIQLYNRRDFRISTVMADEEFDLMKPVLKDKYRIDYNPVSANEHVGEIERMIRVVKER